MTAADRAGARPVTTAATIRRLRPSDYGTVIAVIDEWWGGRPMSDMLPRLFFEHFADTSFAADRAGTLTGSSSGSCPSRSPARPTSTSWASAQASGARDWADGCMRPSSRRPARAAARWSGR